MTFLDNRLTMPPHDSGAILAILERLWSQNIDAAEYKINWRQYNAYIQHTYSDLCRIGCAGIDPASAFTHRQLLDVCEKLLDPQCTRDAALQTLGPPTAKNERLVRLAAAVLVPLNISGVGGGARPGRSIDWGADQTLRQLFEASIGPATNPVPVNPTAVPIPVQLSTKFNIYNFKYIAGFDIVWTSIITDHLRVIEIDDSIKLYLFHQTGLLEQHLDLSYPIIPADFIIETLETLALLIPKRDRDVKRRFDKLQKKYDLDPGAGACDHLAFESRSLDHFVYWKNRLKIIKELYDGQEPSTPLQAWRDRRKPVQWWTFWIAVSVFVLTVVFGLIQSTTGILQAENSH